MKLKLNLNNNAIPLTKKTGDAGYDVYTTEEFVVLDPGKTHLFPTGIYSEMDEGYYIEICERGSTGSKGIARRCGIIDASYRGEWFICLQNTTDRPICFTKEPDAISDAAKDLDITVYPLTKAIAQAIVRKVEDVEMIYCAELSQTERGAGKLGSSGK